MSGTLRCAQRGLGGNKVHTQCRKWGSTEAQKTEGFRKNDISLINLHSCSHTPLAQTTHMHIQRGGSAMLRRPWSSFGGSASCCQSTFHTWSVQGPESATLWFPGQVPTDWATAAPENVCSSGWRYTLFNYLIMYTWWLLHVSSICLECAHPLKSDVSWDTSLFTPVSIMCL